MFCRHCGKKPVSRPRGLCWGCYYTSGVRERYPSTSPHGHRGVRDSYRRGAVPPEPTRALPGSPEKVRILEQRASLGQSLWHPEDVRWIGRLQRNLDAVLELATGKQGGRGHKKEDEKGGKAALPPFSKPTASKFRKVAANLPRLEEYRETCGNLAS